MTRFLITCCFVMLLLCGCYTSYVGLMDSWVGSSEVELIERWGEPASVIVVQGGKVLTYEIFWQDRDKAQNRGRAKFNVDKSGTVVSWSKTNLPNRLMGRVHSDLIR